MALLDQLMKHGYKVAAVHINYQIPDVSDLGEHCARKYCRKHRIRLHYRKVKHDGNGNFEAWARDYRYAYFKDLAVKHGYAGIFMGHQEDDLIETYRMQKEKNSGYSYWGLRTEGNVNGLAVIRPLLDNTKKELLDYVKEHHIPYYLDYTNDTRIHRRNEIRMDEVTKMSREERDMIRKEIDLMNQRLHEKNEQDRKNAECLDPFDPETYQSFTEEERTGMIRRYLIDQGVEKAYHFTGVFLKQLDRQLCSGKNQRMMLGENLIWDLDYGKLRLHEPAKPYEIVRKNNRKIRSHPVVETSEEGESVNGVYLTKEDFPVTVRSFRESDSIKLRYGTKRVSRFFIDRKIPRYEREMWPVIENKDGEIILVPGIGCDLNHYKVPYNCYLRKKVSKQ